MHFSLFHGFCHSFSGSLHIFFCFIHPDALRSHQTVHFQKRFLVLFNGPQIQFPLQQTTGFFFVFPFSRLQAFQMFDFHIQCSLCHTKFLFGLCFHFFFDIQDVLQGISELCHLSHS